MAYLALHSEVGSLYRPHAGLAANKSTEAKSASRRLLTPDKIVLVEIQNFDWGFSALEIPNLFTGNGLRPNQLFLQIQPGEGMMSIPA